MTELDGIIALVLPVVTDAGYVLYDVLHNGSTLSVLVDGADGTGGVDVDDLGRLSRQISALLDELDPISGRYTLEVSSPGVERRLRLAEHFAGAVGEIVNIRTLAGPSGRRRLVGALREVEGDLLLVDDRETGETRLRINEIEKARTVFEWGPKPKPGGRKGDSPRVGAGSSFETDTPTDHDTGGLTR